MLAILGRSVPQWPRPLDFQDSALAFCPNDYWPLPRVLKLRPLPHRLPDLLIMHVIINARYPGQVRPNPPPKTLSFPPIHTHRLIVNKFASSKYHFPAENIEPGIENWEPEKLPAVMLAVSCA